MPTVIIQDFLLRDEGLHCCLAAIESVSEHDPDANSSLSETDGTFANRQRFRSAGERFDFDCTLGIVPIAAQFAAATTPRPSVVPPTMNGLPTSDESSRASTEQ